MTIERQWDWRNVRSRYYRACFESSQFAAGAIRLAEIYPTDYADFPVFAEVETDLDKLRFNVLGLGTVSIWETPHFAFFERPNGLKIYSNYIEDYYGISEISGSVDKFNTLKDHLLNHPERRSLLGRTKVLNAKWILIVDGTHRAALAAHRLEARVKVLVTDR